MEKHDDTAANNALYNSPKNRAAYELLLPEAQAIKEDELIHITVDIPAATAAVSQKEQMLEEMRADVVSNTPNHNMKLYDGLKPTARALRYAESKYQTALSPPAPTGPLFEQLEQRQQLLGAQIHVHVLKGEMPALKADAVILNNGHRQKVTNGLNMVVHVREHWERIAGKTAITEEELLQMEGIAERLDEIIGLNESQPARIAEASLIRNQFYTMLVRSLREVYRAVHYNRTDRIPQYMPAVYAKRGRSSSVERDDSLEPDAPAAQPPAAPATSTPATLPADDRSDPVPVGMPGSNPFLRNRE